MHAGAPYPAGDFHQVNPGKGGAGELLKAKTSLCPVLLNIYCLNKKKECIQHLWCAIEFNLNGAVFEALGNKELRWKCHQKSQTRFTHDCLHGFLSRFAYFKRCVSIGKHRRAFNIDHYRARGLSELLRHGWQSPEYFNSDVITSSIEIFAGIYCTFCQV